MRATFIYVSVTSPMSQEGCDMLDSYEYVGKGKNYGRPLVLPRADARRDRKEG